MWANGGQDVDAGFMVTIEVSEGLPAGDRHSNPVGADNSLHVREQSRASVVCDRQAQRAPRDLPLSSFV